MKHAGWIRTLFVIASIYDLGLGLAFAAAGREVFQMVGFADSGGWPFIRFAAALVAIFGLMFLAVAVNPWGNRNLIPFGMLLKLAYCSFVVYYSISTSNALSRLWQIFGVADLVFLILFAAALAAMKPAPASTT